VSWQFGFVMVFETQVDDYNNFRELLHGKFTQNTSIFKKSACDGNAPVQVNQLCYSLQLQLSNTELCPSQPYI